ncbi:MAG: hypothetical protein II515_01465 [Desulfovibrio sp.]|nr:hypothetical protein [Desulfovibrio sp.]
MLWSKTLFSALTLSLLLGAGAAGAATKVPVVKEVEDRGEIDQIKCDGMEGADVHVGDTLNFYVSFTAENNAKAKVSGVHYWFWSDIDYNSGDPGITFEATKEFKNGDGVVQNQTLTLMRSTDYVIRATPEKPSKENIIVKYDITFNTFNADGTLSPQEEHTVQCARYRVLPKKRK